jgi:hypothetical protein
MITQSGRDEADARQASGASFTGLRQLPSTAIANNAKPAPPDSSYTLSS